MQRPIVLLALVAVLAAALGGLFWMLREPAQSPADGPATTHTAPTPARGTSQHTDTEPVSPDRAPVRGSAVDRTATRFENRLVGTVVDEQQQPIADAQVTLTSAPDEERGFSAPPARPVRMQPVRTGTDGRFEFGDLEPRNAYALAVSHTSYARVELTTVPVGVQGTFTEPPIVLTHGLQLTGFVRDDAGKAIANATLHLEDARFQGSPTPSPDRMTIASAADGAYAFANVAPGRRILTASADGFGTATLRALTFDPNAEPQTQDVVLKPAEQICGRVTGAGGEPLAGVVLTAIGFNVTQNSVRATATTDANGDFCVAALLPGKYNLTARVRGYRFGATQVNTNSARVALVGQRESEVRGQVVDGETGKPSASFHVRLRTSYPGAVVSQPVPGSDQAVTNANGEYVIVGVQQSGDATYVVEAWATGYAPARSKEFLVEGDRDVTGVDLRLGHGGRLRGRVVDADGKPIAGALVAPRDDEWMAKNPFAAPFGTDAAAPERAEAYTDAQGAFVVENLLAQTYQISISAVGHATLSRRDVAVTSGQETDLGELRLTRGGRVQGKLLDDGRPLVGGWIDLVSQDGDDPAAYRVKAGLGGAFDLANVAPGAYRLVGSAPEGNVANPFEDPLSARSTEIELTVAEGESKTGLELTVKH